MWLLPVGRHPVAASYLLSSWPTGSVRCSYWKWTKSDGCPAESYFLPLVSRRPRNSFSVSCWAHLFECRRLSVNVCMYVCMYVWYVNINFEQNVCMYACMYACISDWLKVYMYVCMYVCYPAQACRKEDTWHVRQRSSCYLHSLVSWSRRSQMW